MEEIVRIREGIPGLQGEGDSASPFTPVPSSEDFVIIRESPASDRESNQSVEFDVQLYELEKALQNAVNTIVIEPPGLGDETSRWICIGNFLHKSSVLTGLAGILTASFVPHKPAIYFTASALSLTTTSFYFISWQSDACSKYQVESNPSKLPRIYGLNSSSPVVLVRRDDSRRKILQSVFAVSSIIFCSIRFYFWKD